MHRLAGAGDGAVGRKLKLRSDTTCRFVRSSATRSGPQQIDSGQILADVRWRGIPPQHAEECPFKLRLG